MSLTAAGILWERPAEPPAGDIPHEDMLVEVLVEAQSYRTLAQQAIHALHDLTVECDRQRQQHHRLLDEYRRLREQILRAEAR